MLSVLEVIKPVAAVRTLALARKLGALRIPLLQFNQYLLETASTIC